MAKYTKSRCNKVRYKTKRQAEKGLGLVQVLNASQGKEKKNKGLHVYDCPDCDFWHIGHERVNKDGE